MRDYDNADLGIAALLLLGIATVVVGQVDQSLIATVVAAIAGIASKGTNGNPPSQGK